MARLNDNQFQPTQFDELVINLDGGSATLRNRTQFIKRMVEWSRAIATRIRVKYYPPYHSKYNPIERCWAALENYWNGAIYDSVEAVVQWATNMSCNGCTPTVHILDTIYEKGLRPKPQGIGILSTFKVSF
ncbi:MAG: hypothetical protein F6K50_34370 [Moorea sp. SIO3I7]|uniref:Transposase n=1 Tax=Moorena bouillonii PNG TaxID=568701 RepID=A0A1U7MYE9_9CYAN|nr:hypothetical protein [Moorena sp. SIO3I7]OLT58712.1 hypothetical protein BJP37_06290 [Moorena bouillonii PNG]